MFTYCEGKPTCLFCMSKSEFICSLPVIGFPFPTPSPQRGGEDLSVLKTMKYIFSPSLGV